MVLASPGPLLTPLPSSSPPKTPIWSYSDQTPPRNGNPTTPPPGGSGGRVLVRRTASPAHADFGGLSSLATLAVLRLDFMPLQTSSPRRQCLVVSWADILLDVICGVESAMREGCPGTMTGVSQYWFSGHFRQVFSTPNHYPARTLSTTCGANQAS
jgi:hypothetical protein